MDILHAFNYCITAPNTVDFKIETKPGVGTIGVFRYVDGSFLGSANFEYESREYLVKHNKIKFIERTEGNICKDDRGKLLEQEQTQMFKDDKKLVEYEELLMYKTNKNLLEQEETQIVKNNKILLKLKESEMFKTNKKLLEKEEIVMYKNNYILLKNADEFLFKNKTKELSSIIPTLEKNELKQLTQIINKDIWVNSEIQLQTIIPTMESLAFTYKNFKNADIPNIEVNYAIELKDIDAIKEIFINKGEKALKDDSKTNLHMEKSEHAKELLRYDIHSINKAISKMLDGEYVKNIYKNESKGLEINKISLIDKVQKTLFLYRYNIKKMENKETIKLKKYNITNVNKPQKVKLIKKYNVYTMLKDEHYMLKLYRYFIILKSLKTKLCYKINIEDMAKLTYGKGLLNGTYNYIDTLNKCKYLRTDIIKKMEKPNLKFAQSKNNVRFIDKFKQLYLHKEVTTPIEKFLQKSLKKSDSTPIYKNIVKEFRKQDATPIFIPDLKKYFEVTKRWWVVSPEGEVDEKILPYNYDYTEHPLVGSAGLGYYRVTYPDKGKYKTEEEYEQACLKMLFNIVENMKIQYFIKNKTPVPYDYIPQVYKSHPNSMSVNPYITNDDTYRGIEEMPISINIMMEMINFVANIVHHSATKFCYCTGQEAMWFIMEYLDKWLNMDSTIKELNDKDATEHYYRAYRWIRWEAEKIFFNCDYDKENGRFRGLKYAGELLANLIEYMKNHHYNVVPIFKDISKMDYWRNQSNLDNDPQDDIVYKPDKSKEVRHYNIETKRLDKKASEGMPKIN
ncbi:hypothetical protein [Clostridium scatologenes]|uniref:Uncharacterized protein n=1 Tax=Clostridium scatologenes TaxID=1548 RepID=A0A0E3JP91_CLOSL|nr:hypothetical protein [Clostridium scatologenes]AKA70123.1 hypothetical protein CSCA_2998 [Clostridium scatologenes]